MSNPSFITGLFTPFGTAIDGTSLYVTNSSATSNSIGKFNANTGEAINRTFISGLNRPRGIAIQNNIIYVANQGSNNIQRYNATTGALISLNFIIGLNIPFGLLINNNNLYIVNNGNGTISLYNADTGVVQDINFITGLNSPFFMAINNNVLYITTSGTNNVQTYNATTGSLINSNFISLPSPTGIEIDNIYLYVASSTNNSISIYDINNGSLINSNFINGLTTPRDIVINGNNLYVVNNGNATIGLYNTYSLPCFKEGSKILTDQGYKPIQELRKGDLVKTYKHEFLPIDIIGKREIYHHESKKRVKDQLYQCSPSEYPELFEPLIITGCHSILLDWLCQEQFDKIMKDFGRIYETDGKPRLCAYLDERATVYETPGTYTIYHLALENEDYYGNYGIYANGLLVESCSKRYLKELSKMNLIE